MMLLFGAGHYALAMKRYLQDQGQDITGILVSKKNADFFEELPLYTPQEFCHPREDCEIVFGLSERYHAEVEDLLRREGFHHFVHYSDDTLQAIYEKYNSVNDWIIDKYRDFFPEKKRTPDSLNNILVIRLDGIGDAVLTTPFLRELRRNLLESRITFLVSDLAYNLFEFCPYVDRVVSVNWEKEIMNGLIDDNLQNAKRFMTEKFNGEIFDVVIVPRYDADYYGSTFLSLFSGAPYRLAYSENTTEVKAKTNRNYDIFFSHVICGAGVFHEVERNLQILEELGMEIQDDRLELWHDDKDFQIGMSIARIKDLQVLRGKKVVAIGLAGSAEYKKWNSHNYIVAINNIIKLEQGNVCFVLFGGQEDVSQGETIVSNAAVDYILDLTNRLSLRQIYCLMKYCSLYVGHDTGLMHIACAAGIPIVEICSFPTRIEQHHVSSLLRFGPWKTAYVALHPPSGLYDRGCWRNESGAYSINDISPQCVVETVCKIIG